MEELQYSIIYALIRPEIDERISVGIIFCQDEKIDVRYSNNLLSVSERRTVRMSGSLSKDKLYKLYVYDSSRHRIVRTPSMS